MTIKSIATKSLLFFLIPYLIGVAISSYFQNDGIGISSNFKLKSIKASLLQLIPSINNDESVTSTVPTSHPSASSEMTPAAKANANANNKATATSADENQDPFDGVSFTIHRNGELEPCGSTPSHLNVHKIMRSSFPDLVPNDIRNSNINKYRKYSSSHQEKEKAKFDFEFVLTSIFGGKGKSVTADNSNNNDDGNKDHHQLLLSKDQCGPEQMPDTLQQKRDPRKWGRGNDYKIDGVDSSFLTFCDMGVDHTPILPDHDKLVRIEHEVWDNANGNVHDRGSAGGNRKNRKSKKKRIVKSLPCHFHTREGQRITSMEQLTQLARKAQQQEQEQTEEETPDQEVCTISDDGEQTCQKTPSSTPNNNKNNKKKEVHLYAVPAGRVFVFTPSFIGEEFYLDHIDHVRAIKLRVMSVSPRVFDVINFFEPEESAAIVKKALAETSESHKMKRSSTGASGYNVNSQRTSENGFDTHGATAMEVKQRTFEVLGFDEYIESFSDGLQVLRYNKTTAYIPHMDWIDDPAKVNRHDFDSAGVGTNRFATVLLYMSDLNEGDGGETLFKHAWPNDVPVGERKTRQDVLPELRSQGLVRDFREGSWEETMVADCQTRLAVRPHSARAVLFYSQHPNGEEDDSSLHGGCPVLDGEKWAANNWIWNGPRSGYGGSPINKHVDEPDPASEGKVTVTFSNSRKNSVFADASLYFQETKWGDFGFGATHNINSFEGHEWNIKDSNGKLLRRYTIPKNPRKQTYTL